MEHVREVSSEVREMDMKAKTRRKKNEVFGRVGSVHEIRNIEISVENMNSF